MPGTDSSVCPSFAATENPSCAGPPTAHSTTLTNSYCALGSTSLHSTVRSSEPAGSNPPRTPVGSTDQAHNISPSPRSIRARSNRRRPRSIENRLTGQTAAHRPGKHCQAMLPQTRSPPRPRPTIFDSYVTPFLNSHTNRMGIDQRVFTNLPPVSPRLCRGLQPGSCSIKMPPLRNRRATPKLPLPLDTLCSLPLGERAGVRVPCHFRCSAPHLPRPPCRPLRQLPCRHASSAQIVR